MKRTPEGGGAPPPLHADQDAALDALIGETTALFHRLKVVADEIHQRGRISAGRRGILWSLARGGPQTVPQLARARPVSRQLVQTLVNGLLDEGYVDLRENPAHRRSHLVALSTAGRRAVEQMDRREQSLLRGARLGASKPALRSAARTLRAVREFFESDAWSRRLQRLERASAPRGGSR